MNLKELQFFGLETFKSISKVAPRLTFGKRPKVKAHFCLYKFAKISY